MTSESLSIRAIPTLSQTARMSPFSKRVRAANEACPLVAAHLLDLRPDVGKADRPAMQNVAAHVREGGASAPWPER